MKRFLLFILGLTLMFFGFFVGYKNFLNLSPENSSEKSPTRQILSSSTETVNSFFMNEAWKKEIETNKSSLTKNYKSKYGYSFDYPEWWSLVECENGEEVSLWDEREFGKITNSICEEPHSSGSFHISGPTNIANNDGWLGYRNKETYKINGLSANRYVDKIVGQTGDLLFDMVFIELDQSAFLISVPDRTLSETVLSSFRKNP